MRLSILLIFCGFLLGCAGPETVARNSASERDCLTTRGTDYCQFRNGPVATGSEPRFRDELGRLFFPTEKPLGFIDAEGQDWTAPAQTLTDGATIPPVFVSLIGDPLTQSFRSAAAMHDAYCGKGNEAGPVYHSRNWEDVHRMFYDALIVNGTPPVKAKIMFAAVYLGGPRWGQSARDLSRVSDAALRQEMEWCIRWIKSKNPSRERIIEWMSGREAALKTGAQSAPNWDVLLAE